MPNLALTFLIVYLANAKFKILARILPVARPAQIPTSPQPKTIPRVYVAVTVKITSLMMVHIKLMVPLPIPWYRKLEVIPAPVSGRQRLAILKNLVISGIKTAVSSVYANKVASCGANATSIIVTAVPNAIPNLTPYKWALDR